MAREKRPLSGSRFWGTARAAMTGGRVAVRRLFGRRDAETDAAIGEALATQLDQLKGLAMKLGQIVSYMDVPLPQEAQRALARLQQGATSMSLEQVEQVVESAFGQPVSELFDAFEAQPIAAASIGQVHRATVDKSAVAVKVQYPGVAQTFQRDLGGVQRIAGAASLLSAVDGSAIVDELRGRLAEECDYEREARWQAAFAAAFRDDDAVVVPAVVSARTRRTVLTTAWADGAEFNRFKQLATAEAKNAASRTLIRFTYRGLLQLGTIQADPHPGNYLFEAGAGHVVFLDYGCVRSLDTELVELLREQITAVLENDKPRFRTATVALGFVGKPKRFDFDHFLEMQRHLYKPFIEPRFAFDPSYVREGLEYNGPRNPNARSMAFPPAFVWIARLQWGLSSVLTRLQASGDFRELLREVLAAPMRRPGPPDEPALAI